MTVKDNYRHVFTVKTGKQQYYLVASSEADMNRWIGALCDVCGITKENDDDIGEWGMSPRASPLFRLQYRIASFVFVVRSSILSFNRKYSSTSMLFST